MWVTPALVAANCAAFSGLDIMAASGPIGFIIFLLMGPCAALCQQRGHSYDSLPDAPSAQVSARTQRLRTRADDLGSRMTPTRDALGIGQTAGANGSRTIWFDSFTAGDNAQTESRDFLAKQLYPALLNRKLNYHPSTSGGLVSRATYAASRIVFTRDYSGSGRLNTSYFLGVLSSAMIHTAYRPYWNRPVSAPFSDFGSTIGNDAGMNLLHEFGPGLQQLVKNHSPKFVSRLEERLSHN